MFHKIVLKSYFFVLTLTLILSAQVEAQFTLPGNPQVWLNSRPLTNEALRGKGTFLWFFEENCPKCRAKWPELYALAKKYEGQPVVFIAVNSGNAPATVQQYARGVQLGWPVIVDPTRQFEKQADVGEISLQNIMQIGAINGKGRYQNMSFTDPEKAVEFALQNSAWKVSPEEIPASLRQAWLAIELNEFSSAAPAVSRALKSRNPDIQESAQKLQDAAMSTAEPQLTTARKALEAGENWNAYRNFSNVATIYKGFDLPRDVEDNIENLANDEQVKHELEALKVLNLIERGLQNQRAKRGNQKRLQKLIEDYPDTSAAEQAQKYIEQLSAS
ncbi:TlpA family protein disulfide reductase [bacterium]|jgi:thiol-disulfide isomerase/thioredoxin|nr:TlpA family protein disulfide reductase [Planctomicrobium sp.]MDA7528097.1 TlpA family protein disulfide reductase [bacterium]